MNYNILLEMAADLGHRLAISGAETFRVEESVSRILSAYGISSEVFAIPNCLTVSIETTEGKPMTRMRRIHSISNNMDSVERYNDLSRRICAQKPDPEIAVKWLKDADNASKRYGILPGIMGHILVGSGFAIFFGGDLIDCLCAGLCGVLVYFTSMLMKKMNVNDFFSTIASTFFMTLLAFSLACAGIINNVDATIIGTLMLLVPGLLFTNAMRDILFGDTNSGVNRIVQVLLIGVALALGTGASWSLISSVWAAPPAGIVVTHSYLAQCIAAGVGSAGFIFVFNVHGRGSILCAIGGALAWAAYCVSVELGCSEILAYFFAAVISALFSEAMARVRKCPAIAYLVVSLIPMFPGAGIYYATQFFVQGNMNSCVERGANTLGIAGAIAVGILTISTIFRLYSSWVAAKKH